MCRKFAVSLTCSWSLLPMFSSVVRGYPKKRGERDFVSQVEPCTKRFCLSFTDRAARGRVQKDGIPLISFGPPCHCPDVKSPALWLDFVTPFRGPMLQSEGQPIRREKLTKQAWQESGPVCGYLP